MTKTWAACAVLIGLVGVAVTGCKGQAPLDMPLTVTLAGTGTGTVRIEHADGFSFCPPDCQRNIASGETVTLTATADEGSVFAGFGACGDTATVTIMHPHDLPPVAVSCTATFNLLVAPLELLEDGDGDGHLDLEFFDAAGAPSGTQTCEEGCTVELSQAVEAGTHARVVVTPVAKLGSTFDGWHTCNLGMGAIDLDVAVAELVGGDSCTARFEPLALTGTIALRLPLPQAGSTSANDVEVTPNGTLVYATDQEATVAADVVDSNVSTVDPATPGSAHHVVLPGAQVRGVAPLAAGARVVGGRKFGTPAGPWLGGLGATDTLTWQGVLAGGADDVFELAPGPGGGALVLGRMSADNTLFVTDVSAAGVLGPVTRIDDTAFPNAFLPLSGGGYAVATSVFLNPARDSFVKVVAANGTITWQKKISGNFAQISGLAEASDGGVIAFGNQGATGATSDAFIIRFAADGTPMWQRTLGTSAAVRVNGVIPMGTGFRVLGSRMGAFLLIELNADGTPTAVRSYSDGGMSLGFMMGGGALPGGGVAFAGANAGAGTLVAVTTAPDGTLSGCGDAAFGASLDLALVPSAVATTTITDSTFIATSLPAFTLTPTTVAPTTTDTTAIDLCSN